MDFDSFGKLSSKGAWQVEAVDAEGRKRFHGSELFTLSF